VALGLGCFGAASAQSTVSLYGLVDMSAGRFQNAGATKLWKADSGNMTTSFIGFKGSEDLGGGLKANFAIESFLRADSGDSGRFGGDVFWARAANVGLSGGFGAVSLGRVTNQFFVSTLIFNAFGDSFGFSPAIRQILTPRAGMQPFYGDTGWSNAVLYSSPKFGGLSFNLQANLGEGSAGAVGKNIGGNVLYFGGPLSATLAIQQVKNNNGRPFTPVAGFDSQDSVQIGAAYDLGVAKLMGQYSQTKTKATVDTKATYYGLGASIPLAGGKVLAQYSRTKADLGGATDPVNKTLTLGYDYNLSKSTDVYAVLMNDKFTGATTGTTYAAGIRLKF
jgi:predicted porin